MRGAIFILLILIAEIYCSCNPVQSAPLTDPLTENFRVYLKVNYDDSIPKSPHLFILVSKKDSRENVAGMLNRLNSEIEHRKAETITSVISVNMPLADSLLPHGKIHTDWNATIDKLNFNLSAVTLLKTDSNKVIAIFQFPNEQSGMEKQFLEK